MDQSEIHTLVLSGKERDRKKAARIIESSFQYLPNKDLVWQDLRNLTQDHDWLVRKYAVNALMVVFCDIPDKKQAWCDLLELTQDENISVKSQTALALRVAASCLPREDDTWQDILKLTQEALLKFAMDIDISVKRDAAILLGSAIFYVPDKDLVYRNLQRLLSNEQDIWVRNGAAIGLGLAIQHLGIEYKAETCQIIHELSKEKEELIRAAAATALGHAFQYFPDRIQASEDLYRLIQDENDRVRWMATEALGLSFFYISDKVQAWRILLERTQDWFLGVRRYAIDALKSSFPYVIDKKKAWKDFSRLTNDKDEFVRRDAAFALKHIVVWVSEMDEPWMDLIMLTQHADPFVKRGATDALGSSFIHMSDNEKAWKDLRALTRDDNNIVRAGIAGAIGSVFSQLPDRNLAWSELNRLTDDDDSYVRMYAYYSLGRASVLKAIETDDRDTTKKELEAAVVFFERSSQESAHSPARFCNPFYRSYFAIIFQGAKEDEVQRYLAEANAAVGRSESKDELLKAIANLAQALQESQRLKDRPFHEIVSELNAYRWYCEKAAEHMAAAEDKAPVAVRLMKKCNPLLEQQIQTTIAEIQVKARLIGPEIEREARGLSLGNPVKVYQCSMRIASTVRALCKRLPEELRKSTHDILVDIEKDEDLSVVLGKIELAMAYTLPVIEAERSEVLGRLKNIEFSMAKLSLSSGSARQDLFELKTIIENFRDRTEARGFSMEELSEILQERDNTMVERLEKMKESWLSSVEEMAQSLPSCEDTDEILEEIQGLRQSRKRDLLGITGDISSIAGLFVGLIGLAVNSKPA
ncbi:MAG: HEAT repeat domain-containing protein [Methanotrichaceae archaeon]|nr:HEAT repeat domain-containing protein [Methanotrichaceae archaeon]